jgi:hypothetical protein
MDIIEHIVMQLEVSADWRREKAKEFPDDSRNIEAAEQLERLAKEISENVGDSKMYQRLLDLDGAVGEDYNISMAEWLSEELRLIGFHRFYSTGAEFLAAYGDRLVERELPDDDDEIESVTEADIKAVAVKFLEAGGTQEWKAAFDQAASEVGK